MNPRLKRLYDIIFNKVKNGELEVVDVQGYKVDGINDSWNDFKDEIIGAFRKEFWEKYGNKLAEIGAVPNNIISLIDFEKYYGIEDSDVANLDVTNKARYELLRRMGYEKTSDCDEPGYEIERIPTKSGGEICMKKLKEEYPIPSTVPFYCIKNNKYYNGRFPLRNTFTKDIKADRIEIDGVVYFLFLKEDLSVSLRDSQNNERLKGSWGCVDTGTSNSSYDVKFPNFTIQYRSNVKIIKH